RELTSWVELDHFDNDRGELSVAEFGSLPFVPVRMFTVSNVPADTMRGGHAHRFGRQLLICAAGQVDVTLRRGDVTQTVSCTPGSGGLLIPPGVWAQQHYKLPNSVLVVLCSHAYDKNSYIYKVPE
ncbi:MAG: FdtA/QdtA family cupin domain-containing protein, partial [Myxococcota bacterium]